MDDEGWLLDLDEPVALFPLDGVTLFPHALLPLHLFEARYCQMLEHCIGRAWDGTLRTAAPIAMASVDRVAQRTAQPTDPAPLRPVVCVGRILRQESMPDGRSNILLHGVCRARLRSIEEPDGDRLFRRGMLIPLDVEDAEEPSPVVRDALRRLLCGSALQTLHAGDQVREWIGRTDVTTSALVEMASYALIKDDDVRYRLLAEADPHERARIVNQELERIDRLVRIGERQRWRTWPRGLAWN